MVVSVSESLRLASEARSFSIKIPAFGNHQALTNRESFSVDLFIEVGENVADRCDNRCIIIRIGQVAER